MPSGYPFNDLSILKKYEVQVFSPAGVFLDKWRFLSPPAGWVEAINAAIQPLLLTISFGPRTFDTFDEAGAGQGPGTIAQGNIVKISLFGPGLPATGLLRYQGVIMAYQPSIDASTSGQETVTITVVPQSSVLAQNSTTVSIAFGSPNNSGTYVDPVTMFNYFFTNNSPFWAHPYTYPLTLDASNPSSSGITTQYQFNNQSMLSIFQTLTSLLPNNWFFRCNPDLSVTLNQTPTTAQLQFIVGTHMSSVQYSKDWTLARNVAQAIEATVNVTLNSALTNSSNYTSLPVSPLPFALPAGQIISINGNGTTTQSVTTSSNASTGATSVAVTSFTANASYSVGTPVAIPITGTAVGTNISTFGPLVEVISDMRITDVATANALAQGILSILNQVAYRADFRVFDYRGDNQIGVGFDIETIKVGMSAQIQDPTGYNQIPTLWNQFTWGSGTWNASPGTAVTQISQVVQLKYGYDYVDITLANFAPSQTATVAQLLRNFQLFASSFA